MQLKNKILSHFLLAIYLLVVLHHSVSHSHTSEFAGTPVPKPLHQHENFKEVHHEHQFHVGIFHFLGHLFENINHTHDLADEHLLVVQKSSTKKAVDHNSSISPYINGQYLLVFEVNAESLPDPPYHLSLVQKLKRPDTPLRAPPSLERVWRPIFGLQRSLF
ncbi:MAG: hypothetical protein H6573_33815 [Lewinellaceae bacterium]|nr:hypothetical protein [Lewinellaceae bacterium]